MKYPIGIQNFEKIREDGYLYIDKTDMIYNIVKNGMYYFLSRPHRFGKSLLISTLKAYFLGKKELFKGLAIEELEKDWKEYPVLHFDFGGRTYDRLESLQEAMEDNLSKYEKIYGVTKEEGLGFSYRFTQLINNAYKATGKRVVILIDEGYKPHADSMYDKELYKDVSNIFEAFYCVFKSSCEFIRFVFVAGEFRFVPDSHFCSANNLFDISQYYKTVSICGITSEELKKYFSDEVLSLARKYNMTEEKTIRTLGERYGGYDFRGNSAKMYDPVSLMNVFTEMELSNYRTGNEIPKLLKDKINNYRISEKELDDLRANDMEIGCINMYRNSAIPALYQSGFLTIKNYNREYSSYSLGIPNDEVRECFRKYLTE